MVMLVSGLALAIGSVGVFLCVDGSAGGVPTTRPADRFLHDFASNDGKHPNGLDDRADDTAAMRNALSAGPGVVRIGPGFYRFGEVTVPEGITVQGSGPGTVVRGGGFKQVFRQEKVARWAIRDLVLDGEAPGNWKGRKDEGRSGILCEGCSHFEIVGVTIRNFNGAGLQLLRIGGAGEGWGSGSNLHRITAIGNHTGVRFDFRAEYINASQLSCQNNVVGCIVHAGNAKITCSNFTSNLDGLVIEDKENGSHGVIADCLVNHNDRYALLGRGIRNGMVISNCCFFCGTIRLEDCVGVGITSGIINAAMEITGTGTNRIAGNYIIPAELGFEFSPATLVRDNFTDQGPWDRNTMTERGD